MTSLIIFIFKRGFNSGKSHVVVGCPVEKWDPIHFNFNFRFRFWFSLSGQVLLFEMQLYHLQSQVTHTPTFLIFKLKQTYRAKKRKIQWGERERVAETYREKKRKDTVKRKRKKRREEKRREEKEKRKINEEMKKREMKRK
jgi:hypothetical protein